MSLHASDSTAPWRDPELLPWADPVEGGRVEGWGWYLDGQCHGISLDGLRDEIRTEVARVTAPLKGFVVSRPTVPTVALVAAPDQTRLLTVAEVPELAEEVVAREAAALEHELQSQRKPAFIFATLFLLACPFLVLMGFVAFPLITMTLDTVVPFLENRSRLRRLKAAPEAFLADLNLSLRYHYWLSIHQHQWDLRTWALALAWAALFLLQLGTGFEASIGAAALVKPRLLAEPWRLLTGALLHGSLMHLLMNGLGMLAMGPVVERLANRRLLLPLWVAGAICGSLMSWLIQPRQSSVGASGGLMALVGYLAVVGHAHRADLPLEFLRAQVRSILGVALLGILAYRVIDNGGHLGGLLLGLLVGGLHRLRNTPLPLPTGPWIVLLDLGALALALAAVAFTGLRLLGHA